MSNRYLVSAYAKSIHPCRFERTAGMNFIDP